MELDFEDGKAGLPGRLAIDGEVREGQLMSRVHIQGMGLKLDIVPNPIQMSARDGCINTMHPLEKGPRGLHEGRKWQVPVIDSEDLLQAVINRNVQIGYLNAEVTSGHLRWQGADQACWVIDYRKGRKPRILARTWVRKSDRVILRQEAEWNGTHLVMERGPLGRR
jgi:hypothetical protein